MSEVELLDKWSDPWEDEFTIGLLFEDPKDNNMCEPMDYNVCTPMDYRTLLYQIGSTCYDTPADDEIYYRFLYYCPFYSAWIELLSEEPNLCTG